MQIVCISDTHNFHSAVDVPDGDILIHAGDGTISGTREEVTDLADWMSSLPHKWKIFVPGNHDWLFEKHEQLASAIMARGVVHLQDDLCFIEGLRIYGSPWQPEFFNWAFNLPRGKALADKWAQIPEGIDILITHGPPHGILDEAGGLNKGCYDLLDRVKAIQPRLHVFGHIHEGYGEIELYGTTFVNASICDAAYNPCRKPIVIEFEERLAPTT